MHVGHRLSIDSIYLEPLLSCISPDSELILLTFARRAEWRRFSDIAPVRNRRETKDAK